MATNCSSIQAMDDYIRSFTMQAHIYVRANDSFGTIRRRETTRTLCGTTTRAVRDERTQLIPQGTVLSSLLIHIQRQRQCRRATASVTRMSATMNTETVEYRLKNPIEAYQSPIDPKVDDLEDGFEYQPRQEICLSTILQPTCMIRKRIQSANLYP